MVRAGHRGDLGRILERIREAGMSKALSWTTKRVKLGDLLEWDKNPVEISERDAKELARSLAKFDHVLPYVAAAPPNGAKGLPLLDGHQRKAVEIALNKVSPNTLVDVRVPSRVLTEKERSELAIRLRKNSGQFDPDALLNWFEGSDLLDWGFAEDELEEIGFDLEYSGNPTLLEKTENVTPKKHLHILISMDLSESLEAVFDVKEKVSDIEKIPGVEVLYGGN